MNKKEDLKCLKQAGTGPSRRHIQGSKIAKRLPSVKYSLLQYSKTKNFLKITYSKNGPSGALKSHNAEKLKGGPFEVFQHPFCRKTWKKLKKTKISTFGKKSHNAEKTEKGDPLGFFNIHSVA